MSIGYVNPLPVPTNNPSADVANMVLNTAAVAAIWDVDHVGFNSGSSPSGQHEQVTFNANISPASFPVPYSIAFADAQVPTPTPANLPGLFFYPAGASADQSENQYTSSAKGSTFLLGGIILKWGTVTVPSSSFTGSDSFTQPFPNAAFVAVGTQTSGVLIDGLRFITSSTSAVTATALNTSSGDQVFFYIAIGN